MQEKIGPLNGIKILEFGSFIAGPFAGSVFGITNTMAQIPGFVNPMLVAYLTPNVSNLMKDQEIQVTLIVKLRKRKT